MAVSAPVVRKEFHVPQVPGWEWRIVSPGNVQKSAGPDADRRATLADIYPEEPPMPSQAPALRRVLFRGGCEVG